MYVCICNCLTEKAVRETASTGNVRSADDLFAALDVEPICGCCKDFADDIIEEVAQDNCVRPMLRVVNGG
jgi:bacterioferritin-associated ferredoxin